MLLDAAPIGACAVSPESTEGRERLTRIEERVEANRRQIEVFGPLPLQVGLIQKGLDDLADDLRAFERAHDARFEKFERRTDENIERLTRSFENQIAACSSAVGRVAELQEKADRRLAEWQESERLRHERARELRERQEREDAAVLEETKTQRFVAKYGLIGVLAAATITAVATIINTLVS